MLGADGTNKRSLAKIRRISLKFQNNELPAQHASGCLDTVGQHCEFGCFAMLLSRLLIEKSKMWELIKESTRDALRNKNNNNKEHFNT
jgi:hypothetical protein